MVEKYRNIQLQYSTESCKVVPLFLSAASESASSFPQMTVESQRNKKITLWIFSCSVLLHSFHELQELCNIKEDTVTIISF